MGFTPLGEALFAKMNLNSKLKKQVEAGSAVAFAEQVFLALFGEEGAKQVKPLFLKNRTLTVTCVSSVIAQEIRLNQAAIVQQINDKMGKNEVDRIRYLT